ncbi:MAG TPA: hypothetical protein VGG64_19445 [Pirellulales bacterium]
MIRLLLAINPNKVLSDAGFIDARRLVSDSQESSSKAARAEACRQLRHLVENLPEDALRNAQVADRRKVSLMDDELRRLLVAIESGAISSLSRIREILKTANAALNVEEDSYRNDRYLLMSAQQAFVKGQGFD